MDAMSWALLILGLGNFAGLYYVAAKHVEIVVSRAVDAALFPSPEETAEDWEVFQARVAKRKAEAALLGHPISALLQEGAMSEDQIVDRLGISHPEFSEAALSLIRSGEVVVVERPLSAGVSAPLYHLASALGGGQ